MDRLPQSPVVDLADPATRHPVARRRGSVAPILGLLALVVAVVLAVMVL